MAGCALVAVVVLAECAAAGAALGHLVVVGPGVDRHRVIVGLVPFTSALMPTTIIGVDSM